MKNSFTPGPWVVKDGDRFSMEIVITSQSRIQESMVPICEMDVDYDGEHGEEQHANAKLIASAPELLEALIALHAVASVDRDKDYSAVTNAAAIIAKATS